MHFASLKAQDRRIGGWNWPRIARIKQTTCPPIFVVMR